MDINKYVGEMIRHYRKRNHLTQEELAEVLKTTSQTISRYETGALEANHNTLFKLADYFKININEFFPPMQFDNGVEVDTNNDVVKIPVLGTIKAGIAIEAQQDIIEYIEIPKVWTTGGRKYYGLRISGDSMYPKYAENDTVVFEDSRTYRSDMYNNKDCAIMVNGDDATFKKVTLTENGITLTPYNLTNYEVRSYSKEDIINKPIRVIGIAREKRTKV